MKRKFVTSALAVAAMFSGLAGAVSAQERVRAHSPQDTPLLVEDFNYTAGSVLTTNGWSAHSGAGTNAISVAAPGLTYSGYPSSSVGNTASLTTTGEDDSKTFTSTTSGSVYAAVMVNVSASQAAGDYFFHLIDTAGSTNFRGRVFVKKDAASSNFAFGISKSSTSTINYTPFNYTTGTTYLLVLKYTFNSGSTTDDDVALFINPALGGAEPSSTISYTDTTSTDISQIGVVALRQGSASNAPTLQADGIRVGTSWAAVTTASAPVDAPLDFNGDGKTDFTVVRNTGGGAGGQITWFYNFNGSSTYSGAQWGSAGDFYVPADYDGDGKDDIAVWRGSLDEPAFFILQSGTNTVRADAFGLAGDDPRVVGDYDGDGIADVAVFRSGASAGQPSAWYYRSSISPDGVTGRFWGENGDFPAPGDYDGDGKYDYCVQRNAGNNQAVFWVQLSNGTVQPPVYFGYPNDSIVPGDYDGDGKTDIAIARSVGGSYQWWIRSSQTGNISGVSWGTSATDFLAQGDYDGDGKTDPAIWRSSTTPGESAFWALGSQNGSVIATAWGQSGDYPVANFNVH
jgi:hypothetical protein